MRVLEGSGRRRLVRADFALVPNPHSSGCAPHGDDPRIHGRGLQPSTPASTKVTIDRLNWWMWSGAFPLNRPCLRQTESAQPLHRLENSDGPVPQELDQLR